MQKRYSILEGKLFGDKMFSKRTATEEAPRRTRSQDEGQVKIIQFGNR